ncbi:LptF/LptG family permease [bacterium]|nr:LptF/LptG family permease [bacterium]
MTIMDRYVLRKHVGPFLFAIATITFIFVMRVLVDFLGLFASRDVGFRTIVETITLSLGWIFALTFPMAVLVAVVMAFGRLSQDFELDALHAGGRSFLRTVVPVILAGVVLAGGLMVYNNLVLPEANHRLKTLSADIRKMKPTIVIREGVFITDFPGYTMLVREVDDEHSIIRDVTIYTLDPREPVKTIHAPWGELSYTAGGNELVIRLHDGEMHEVDPDDPASYLLAEFKVHNLIFGDLGTQLERRGQGISRGDRELSAGAMQERVRGLEEDRSAQADSLGSIATEAFREFRRQVDAALDSRDAGVLRPVEFLTRAKIAVRRLRAAERRVERTEREIHRYQVEIHKKYSFPVACIVFVMVGAPLGARVRRGGAGVGGALSFLFFLVYYMASLGGEKLGDRGYISPAVGMWGIDVLLGIGGMLLLLRIDSRWPFRSRVRSA